MNAQNLLKWRMLPIVLLTVVSIAVSIPAAAAEEKGAAEETKEAAAALRDYSIEQKDAAVEKAGELLDTLDERIAVWEKELEENWDDLQQAGREKYSQTLASLKEERKKLAGWYDNMKHSSKEAWGEAKEGFNEAYASFVRSWKKTEQEIEKE